MVRKSERNKTKAGPDKSPEKSRKTVRQSRRRKKSSSDSEPGPDIPVEETKPEQKPSSEPLDTPKAELSSPKVEVKDSEATSSGVNRPKRRKQTLEAEPAAKPQSTDREWKEDETFWANSESVVETSEAKSTEDEGTLWKVQSANGSSGEIQKLKICRQKPADVSESSPSHVKDTSPCRKKSARLSHSETGKDSPQTSECEASGSAMTETETPSSTVPDQSEPVPADSTDARVETQEATSETMQPDVTEQPLPEPSEAGPEKQDLPTQSDEQTPSAVEEPSVSEQPEEAVVEEGNKTEETPNSTEDMRAEPVQTSSSRSSPEKEAPDSSTRRKQDGSDSSDSSSDTNSSSAGERGDRKRLKKRRRLSKSSGGAQGGDEAQKPESVVTAIESVNDPPGEEKSENEVVEKQEQEEPPQPQEEEKMDCVEESKPAENKIVTPETEEPPQPEQQTKTENETAEEAKQTTGEKMEEEPPKESGEKTVEEEKEKPPAESKVDHSEKEEGEISPARDPPAAKDRIEKTTAGRTKIIINKPQNENTSKPTILKRVPVEAPPAQRKRRTVSKAKPKEQSIAISSTSLKLIVPEAKPLPLEEVDLSIEEEKEAEEEEEEEEEEPKPKRMVNLSKSRDIEIRVKNDVREVTKKEPIVMEKKVVKEEKPKETTVQPPPENHKVVRKISIVSDDAKKLTRSPSPASRKATAVLFITNLVRPFTAPQLRELLARTGTIAPNGFYIDKIKSKCYVKYTEVEMAVETRHALHGVRWPVNNPKTLKVEFASPEDMALVQELAEDETKKSESVDSGWLNEQAALKPARRVTAGVREWDLGKIAGADGIVPQMKEENVDARKRVVGEGDWSRNKERGAGGAAQDAVDNRRRERPHSPDHKEFPARKVKRRENDAPSKLLDDLFRKTKATPCIYWLPLNAAQIVVKEEMRRQHMAEHERRLAEIRKSEQSRRERERDRRKK